MKEETIDRNYLEIKSINALIESISPRLECSINLVKPDNFQINKFFYKNVGKKHSWTDRLAWSEQNWIRYSSDPKVQTYILKVKNDLAGYFELIFHLGLKEIEIAYFGLLEEYQNKKLGSFLLSSAIKNSFFNICFYFFFRNIFNPLFFSPSQSINPVMFFSNILIKKFVKLKI